MDGQGGPDGQANISEILRSLTAYLPKEQQSPDQPQSGHPNAYWSQSNGHDYQYTPSETIPQHDAYQQWLAHSQANSHQPQATYDLSARQPHSPAQHAQRSESHHIKSRSTTPVQPKVDPRTITTWPAALRHVTKISAINAEFLPRVRSMINNQHDNERQWWEGREALLQQQASRANGRVELDSVLASVGVQASKDFTTEDNETELKRYDVKVHKAQVKMVNVMSEELKGLQVPFFGLKEQDKQNRDLQRKMLGFLEELCEE